MANVRRLLVVLLFGVLLYAAFVFYTGSPAIARSLDVFSWSALALTLLLSCANYGLRFLKWQYYLARLGVRHVPAPDSLLVFLSGFVLSVTPGQVGEVFKSAVLARTHGVPLERTAPIVVAERLSDGIGVIVLVVLGSAGFGGGLFWAGLGGAFVLLGLGCIVWQAPARWLLAAFSRVPRLAPLVPRLREAHESLLRVASLDALALPVALSVVGWGREGLGLHTLLHGFGVSLALTFSLFFYASATLAGAIIPVPGGLGVTEALMQEQLVRIGGAPPGVATASMILIRLCTLWFAVALGFAALGVLRLRFPVLGSAEPLKATT